MLVIGLMSGTSVDGIDAALVEIQGTTTDLQVQLIAGDTYPYPTALRQQILDVCAGAKLSMAELAELDDAIAHCFATAVQNIQATHQVAELIGSHGQTVFHRPATPNLMGYSQQIGRGAVIAQQTGLKVIDNFRAADIAAGGQGAPLVPKVDAYLLSDRSAHRCIQNIGGIGNLTYLPPRSQTNWENQVTGWDTGPGNSLIDLAVSKLSAGQKTYDQDGAWAAQGEVCTELVDRWLQHPYLQQAPPKSTGREMFGWDYLEHTCLQAAQQFNLNDEDFLATLTDFTAASIAHSYQNFLPHQPEQVLLCGGGARNLFLMKCLQARLPQTQVTTTKAAGLDSDFKEAIAFAVLAYWRWHQVPGNLPQVTGSKSKVLLGEVHEFTLQ
jgi:anhydro-N-acetylmuramic acid kinase